MGAVAQGSPDAFFEGVGVAATLQSQSEGRILVEADVLRESPQATAAEPGAADTHSSLSAARALVRGTQIETARGLVEVYEVRS